MHTVDSPTIDVELDAKKKEMLQKVYPEAIFKNTKINQL